MELRGDRRRLSVCYHDTPTLPFWPIDSQNSSVDFTNLRACEKIRSWFDTLTTNGMA
jgi:hypothetical protein